MSSILKLTEAQKNLIREAHAENLERGEKGLSVPGPKWKAIPPEILNFAWQPGILNKGYTVEGIAEAQEAAGIESSRQRKARIEAERLLNLEKVDLGVLPKVQGSPSNSSSLRYPSSPNITEDSDYIALNFFKYDPPFGVRKSPSAGEEGGADDNTKGRKYNYGRSGEYTSSGAPTIILYMPEDISTGYKANWGGKAFSNIARDLLDTAAGETGIDKLMGAGAGARDALGRLPAMGGVAAIRKGIQKITGDSLSNDDVFGATSGAILNPNTELLFESIDMRSFNLNFKLMPRNNDESKQINAIIRCLKETMLPRKNVSGVWKSKSKGIRNGFISVPDLCRVSFMRNGKEHEFLPRYKMCAITQVDVNYTPDGSYATYADGQPAAISLAISFQETKLLFAEDIQHGY